MLLLYRLPHLEHRKVYGDQDEGHDNADEQVERGLEDVVDLLDFVVEFIGHVVVSMRARKMVYLASSEYAGNSANYLFFGFIIFSKHTSPKTALRIHHPGANGNHPRDVQWACQAGMQ